jgi:hypothetical protein
LGRKQSKAKRSEAKKSEAKHTHEREGERGCVYSHVHGPKGNQKTRCTSRHLSPQVVFLFSFFFLPAMALLGKGHLVEKRDQELELFILFWILFFV